MTCTHQEIVERTNSFNALMGRNFNSGMRQSHAQCEQESGFPMSLEADLVSKKTLRTPNELRSGSCFGETHSGPIKLVNPTSDYISQHSKHRLT